MVAERENGSSSFGDLGGNNLTEIERIDLQSFIGESHLILVMLRGQGLRLVSRALFSRSHFRVSCGGQAW